VREGERRRSAGDGEVGVEGDVGAEWSIVVFRIGNFVDISRYRLVAVVTFTDVS
jgi:hypothetical protein